MNGSEIWKNYKKGWGQTANEHLILGTTYRTQDLNALQREGEIVPFMDSIPQILPTAAGAGVAVEIGLCKGGTHLMWRHLFHTVVSIDNDFGAIAQFRSGLGVMESTSYFIAADSRTPVTAVLLKQLLTRLDRNFIDMLFIDGAHDYNSVLCDYINYAPMVRVGGIVAFHDSKTDVGVVQFLEDLEHGKLPVTLWMKEPLVTHFVPQGLGITYYIKGA